MNRLIIAVVTAAAACGIAIPAVAGLSGNPSFSERIPVRLPSSAHVVQFDTAGSVVREADDRRSPSTVPTTAVATHGRHREAEPGDDHGGARTASTTEQGDDHGGNSNGGSSSHGSAGGHGSDDSGHDD